MAERKSIKNYDVLDDITGQEEDIVLTGYKLSNSTTKGIRASALGAVSNYAEPIYLSYKNDELIVISKYGANQDLRATLKQRGPNNLYDFTAWHLISNEGRFPSSDTAGGVLMASNSTDSFCPYQIRAAENADGDNKTGESFNLYFTGGSHNYNNVGTTGPGLATARNVSVSVYVNGKSVSDGFGGYAAFIDLVFKNNIQGYNTTKSDGSGREIITETIHVHFDGVRWSVENTIKALEPVFCSVYYGLAFLVNDWNVNNVFYRGSEVNRGANSVYPGSSNSGDRLCSEVVSIGTNHTVKMGIDRFFDLGGIAKSTRNYSAFGNNRKIYFDLIYQTPGNALALATGETMGVRGYYEFYPTR